MTTTGKRHRLLIYAQLYRSWRGAVFLTAVGLGLLAWFGPPPFDSLLARSALLSAAALWFLFFIYCLVAPTLCYVQCMPTHLRLSTPLYRVAVSYDRIRLARSVMFSAAAARPSRRWLAEPVAGRTAIAVDLYGYPVSLGWLRLWMNEFVLPDTFVGLLLLTPDWMALSRDIEDHRSQWKDLPRAPVRR